jgi:hypothetical protein
MPAQGRGDHPKNSRIRTVVPAGQYSRLTPKVVVAERLAATRQPREEPYATTTNTGITALPTAPGHGRVGCGPINHGPHEGPRVGIPEVGQQKEGGAERPQA